MDRSCAESVSIPYGWRNGLRQPIFLEVNQLRGLFLLLPLVAVVLVGCGGSSLTPPVPVSGKVTLDGKPVADAHVTFLGAKGARSASGKTASDGTFKLTTVNTDDGAPPGEYVVTIAKIESGATETNVEDGVYGDDYGRMMDASASGTLNKLMKNELPDKYASAEQSGLKRTVVKGEPNDFQFDL